MTQPEPEPKPEPKPEPRPEPEPEPQADQLVARPISSSSVTLGWQESDATNEINYLAAVHTAGETRAGARLDLRVAPPRPSGEPLLLKNLGRMRAIRRGHRKAEKMEKERRVLQVAQQVQQVEFGASIAAADAELREVRGARLEEMSGIAAQVEELEVRLERRREMDGAVVAERERHAEESARLRQELEAAKASTEVVERVGAGTVRELNFQIDGLTREKERLASSVARLTQAHADAEHRAERAESEAVQIREEMRLAFGELRKVRSMCQELQKRQKVGDEQAIEMEKQRREMVAQRQAAEEAATAAANRERELMEKLDTARKQGEHDRQVADVRQDEIKRLRDQVREKELVIGELAEVNARLEVQESKLETLLEERERILMNSAVVEVNRLKTALTQITASRDKIRQESQQNVTALAALRKKMAVQEDLVRKAAYTNASYGKRLEDLTLGLQRKHSDVTDAKRKMVAAMEREEELRIQLARVRQEFKLHRDDSVSAQEHKVLMAQMEKAQALVKRDQETARLLRRQATVDSGRYEGVINRLDEKLAGLKAKLDEKLQEEEEALKHGGTATQKLKMEIDRLKARVNELHGTIRSQEKRAVAAETRAAQLEQERKQMEVAFKRATAERQYAMEQQADAERELTQAYEAHGQASQEAQEAQKRLGSELGFVKGSLQKVEQQRTMVVQLLGLLRRLHNRHAQQPLQEELEDYAHYLDIDLNGDGRDLVWIAEQAYFAPLPEQYQKHRDNHGDEFFFNTATGESSYCHPMDNLFRKLAHQFSTERLVEATPDSSRGRPQKQKLSKSVQGASEAIGRVYGATLPGESRLSLGSAAGLCWCFC
eukprot:COSAG01_NODE_3085_length_6574_cov_4.675418_6_plen_836_part_01